MQVRLATRTVVVMALVGLGSGAIGYVVGRSSALALRGQAAPGAVAVRGVDRVPAATGSVTLPVVADTAVTGPQPARRDSSAATRAAARPAAVPPAATPRAVAHTAPRRPDRRRVMLGETDLTGIGYDRGDPGAPLVLIDFSDFGCPFCAEFSREVYPVIDREYVQTGKVFFKYVPFLAGFARGREATRAAECAGDQGKFWEMMDAVYATQASWQKAGDPHVVLRTVAQEAGVDTAAYSACYAVHRTDARTNRATGVAEELRVRVTPSFVLNGRPVEGALPLREFRKLLDAALILAESRD